MTLREVFSSIANAIRSKTGKTAAIEPVNMAAEIESIQTGSGGNPFQQVINNQEGDGKPSAYYLFYLYKGTSLDSVFKGLDTSKVTNLERMFYECTNLTSVPLFDTSSVTDMNNMFNNCAKLTSVPLFDTSKVTKMNYMFYGCSSLTIIPALDTSNVTSLYQVFSHCSKLEEIHMTGMKVKFDISSSTKFTESALVEILNNLATVTSTQTLTMGSTNLAKLTDEEKAIATNKGWTLA